jgi:hypothetical protein
MEWEIGRCVLGTHQTRPAALSVWARHVHGPDAASALHVWALQRSDDVEPGEYGVRQAGTGSWKHLFVVTEDGRVEPVDGPD